MLWLYYNGKKPRYLLVLDLCGAGDKITCIETSKISAESKRRIVDAKNILDELQLDRKIVWIKEHCPEAMDGYRTLYKSKVSIINTYELPEND